MDVFDLRREIISRYRSYVASFIRIKDERISTVVNNAVEDGAFWPEPLLQLNPSFEPGDDLESLIKQGVLHPENRKIFIANKDRPDSPKNPIRLYKHQEEAIRIARANKNYVLTTGTGSGKSLAYIVPIVDSVLRSGSEKRIKAIIVYPMNALANSQEKELEKFLNLGYPDNKGPVTFAKYTGAADEETRRRILANPPDILLTNYVMLELILTRTDERALIDAGRGLKFLVLDELHTYRGRQGADVAMLVRRVRDRFDATDLRCIGTSATMSSGGTVASQKLEVAKVATKIFGSKVEPENVVGETLRRITNEIAYADNDLKRRVEETDVISITTLDQLKNDLLAQWVEEHFGVKREPQSNRLVRQDPRPLSGSTGAATNLTERTGVPLELCDKAIRKVLSEGNSVKQETQFPAFAFRLHQFISRGDTAYASCESPAERYITLSGQHWVPDGTKSKVLLPLCFCRECGQEYYSVYVSEPREDGRLQVASRDLNERASDEELGDAAFLLISNEIKTVQEMEARIPADWFDGDDVKAGREDYVPTLCHITREGLIGSEGITAFHIRAPFKFCPACGVSYDARSRSDFAKLSTLSSEGRSTATTILSLAAVEYLRSKSGLSSEAQKLLSFTDNRQDASLQSGHFNDFIQISLLRAALYQAVKKAGSAGLSHDLLTQAIFTELDLPFGLYAIDPDVRYQALADTNEALRDVLGYRVYRDLERGWRITAPNLEQCGLLKVKYRSLDELCKNDDDWAGCHTVLVSASPADRAKVSKTLLDWMRRELAIKVDYLEAQYQERIRRRNSDRLKSPWGLDENERMQRATVVLPRSRPRKADRFFSYLSPRSGFGQYLRRPDTFPANSEQLHDQEVTTILRDLLKTLRKAGLVEQVRDAAGNDDVPGYQIPASAFVWCAGDGTQGYHDPIRVPQISKEGLRTNQFFVQLYTNLDRELLNVTAREHTAQVKDDERQTREEKFRSGELPILYCSPTMELGVDISTLNVVNMRNIPPTPANYAQRSGRAGRSGQPALVFSYCTTGSSHDQYFFKRPEKMVQGRVQPPRIDLANEDLLRAHVQAIWLAESGQHLGKSLADVVDITQDQNHPPLKQIFVDELHKESTLARAKARAAAVVGSIAKEDLSGAYWFKEGWLESVFTSLTRSFEEACERWRSLYRSAVAQRDAQHKIANDHTRTPEDREKAKRLRDEAESQIALLVDRSNVMQSDFYSYRYFASEGFLPGYNFPRLPLSAYIPGRRVRRGEASYLSRPRFLAIAEFGPRATVYHEGSRYQINRVMLRHDQGELATQVAKVCSHCGYAHPCTDGAGPDLCVNCQEPLPGPFTNLFRLENVSTRRRDRISSDEEERLRLGYELRTAIRFADRDGLSCRSAQVIDNDGVVGTLNYGDSAAIWRINKGWSRRGRDAPLGYLLDTERGFWESNSDSDDDDGDADEGITRPTRVIPFVEDHKNCLLFEPAEKLTIEAMATLQAALKVALQECYQLEDNEISVEPLPERDNRNEILIYESGEGGAGALRRILDDPSELAKVAKSALKLCHFDAETGKDLRRAERSKEDCEAACYDCLLNYGNQPDHALLDRKLIKDVLLRLTKATVEISPVKRTREEHFQELLRFCESTLEKQWLNLLYAKHLRLPSAAQTYIESCGTRPDFMYKDEFVAVYIDGPHHQYPDRAKRDDVTRKAMEEAGYTVLVFTHEDNWAEIFANYSSIFGKGEKE